jgi:hypothetical protein
MHMEDGRTLVLTMHPSLDDERFLALVRRESQRAGPFKLVLELPVEVPSTLELARAWLTAVTDPSQPLSGLAIVSDTVLAHAMVQATEFVSRARGCRVPVRAYPTLERALRPKPSAMAERLQLA